jgi:2-C-methyl-D-erythritol 4-phosphate cytidylyltransferase
MKHFIIIPAAGSGQRFGSTVPKQFAELNGKPVLMHTMERFAFMNERIVLVLNSSFVDFWKDICNTFSFNIPHTIIQGGKTRTESVKSGLSIIKDDGIVAIHDAVRPLISRNMIEKLFKAAAEKGNAVPAVSLHDSLRKVDGQKNYPADRNAFRLIQTPQCFLINKLKSAYSNSSGKEFTDDASVYEASGEKINLIEGEFFNIKITEAKDLAVAEALMKSGITGI